MYTMVVKLECQQQQKAPFLARKMLKCFYDTSTATALEQSNVVLSL
jgi:hypothetical protein